MRDARLHRIRHLLMRLALGFILGWFGVQQARDPSEWVKFVPIVAARYSPIDVTDLILLHSASLILAATGILLGLFLFGSCLLAAGILLQIIISLLLGDGAADVIVRDLGLLGLAVALALDPVRFGNIEMARWKQPPPVPASPDSQDGTSPLDRGMLWRARAIGAALLVTIILALLFFTRRA